MPTFGVKVVNTKTIIPLNFAEFRLILANSAFGLVAYVLGDVRENK